MSLKGDVWTVRNGRCTSEISVFNYPEHLNPFYEEENHKRLRFWKINTNHEGRRKSFSLIGLKDIWSFKSLTLKKKKSSTLGINKTSESPPMFRRDMNNTGSNNFLNKNTRQYRYSTESESKPFERNGLYRNTLTHVDYTKNHTKMESAFERNASHRSTYQMGDGLLQKQSKNSKDHLQIALSRGSSISSFGSTNPFESEEEEVGFIATMKTKKKKKRAPEPPINNVPLCPTHDSITPNKSPSNEIDTIANLTAEIVDFVENAKSEKSSKDSILNSITLNETNDTIIDMKKTEQSVCTEMERPKVVEVGKIECINIHNNTKITVPRTKMKSFDTNSHSTVTGKTMFTVNRNEFTCTPNHENAIRNVDLSADNTNEKFKEPAISSTNESNNCEAQKTLSSSDNFNNFELHEDASIYKPRIEIENIAIQKDLMPESLKILESTENILDSCNYEPYAPTFKINKFHKENSSFMDPWKKSSLAAPQSKIPTEKRRSVQEIIESINRNQQLLGVSKPLLNFKKENSIETSSNLEQNCYLGSPKINNCEIVLEGNIQKTGKQSRDSSPTISNLDWNPLPKPKRSKNLNDI